MSRFTKDTFPEKWQILITKENFNIISKYYSVVSNCYEDKNNIGKWIKSHNSLGEEVKPSAGSSFLYADTNFIDISTDDFKEFVFIENQFILPEKWCVQGINDQTDLGRDRNTNPWCLYIKETGYGFLNHTYYYLDSKGKPDHSSAIPADYTLITFDQFLKYVVKQEPIKEDHSQLIKLLNDAL